MIENENSWLSNYVNTSINTQRINERNEIKSIELKDVKDVVDYAKKKYSENDERILSLQKELNDIDKAINKLRIDYNLLKPKSKSKYQKKVIIQFAARESCEFLLHLSYIVMGATWTPLYAVRVDTANKNCVLNYQGNIVNNTGEDWENVLVTLSSSKPQHEGQPPTLPTLEVISTEREVPSTSNSVPIYHDEYDMVDKVESLKKEKGKDSKNKHTKRDKKSEKKKEESYDDEDISSGGDQSSYEVEKQIAMAMGAQVQQSVSNAVFQIQRPTTIGNDNKPHKVTINNINLDVEFEYIAIPFIIPNAYLKAITVNTSDYSLLEGKMHIFMDSVFVATAKIERTISPNEKMELYLGIDINIKIEALPSTNQSSSYGLFEKK